MKIPRRISTVIINSLKGGVVPRIGLPYITVGRETEIDALLHDVDLIAEGGATAGPAASSGSSTISRFCVASAASRMRGSRERSSVISGRAFFRFASRSFPISALMMLWNSRVVFSSFNADLKPY